MNYLCKHCGQRVRPCRCVAHEPPMWKHTGTNKHGCGPDGLGELAEPSDREKWHSALMEKNAQQRRDRVKRAKPSPGAGMLRRPAE